MSRTGLSPADIAESFRDRCGDGSMEWVYTPTQTWVLLDAADMLDESARLREQLESIVGRSFRTADKMACLAEENAKLRELVKDMLETLYWGDYYLKQTGRTFQPSRYETRMRELGVNA